MTLILFIVVLALLVLVHEWGHFFAARRFGIRVDEFGFGFPPRIFAKRVGETTYTLNLIPVGGFVRIFGEGGEGENDVRSFASHAPWRRAIIIVAGVVMNVALAWILFSIGAVIGTPALAENADVEEARITITSVAPKSPAANGGLRFGNVLYGARENGTNFVFQNSQDLIKFTKSHAGRSSIFLVLPSGSSDPDDLREVTLTPRLDPPAGEGALGIGIADVGIVKVPWYQAPWTGLQNFWYSIRATAEGFWGIVRSITAEKKVPEGISGPLGIFTLTGETRRLGASYFMQFIGLLSVNLAILNILPIPALDGGRLLFILIEKLRGRPIHFEHERLAHAVGFIILLGLIILISIRDVQRIFS